MNCNDKLKIKSYLFISPNDIKEISEKKGIVLKRKYGKFKRDVFKYEPKKNV